MRDDGELDMIIAEYVGDEGFFVKSDCPNGHENNQTANVWEPIPFPVGHKCPECDALFGRDSPLNYTASFDLLSGVVKDWINIEEASNPGTHIHVKIEYHSGTDEPWFCSMFDCASEESINEQEVVFSSTTPVRALAEAFVATLNGKRASGKANS